MALKILQAIVHVEMKSFDFLVILIFDRSTV